MELDYTALGKRIRRRRKELGLTQSVLAERVDLEASNISHIERGASKVGLGSLVKIANVLQCSVDDLLCDSLLWEREAFENELVKLTGDCTPVELRILTEQVRFLKNTLRSCLL